MGQSSRKLEYYVSVTRRLISEALWLKYIPWKIVPYIITIAFIFAMLFLLSSKPFAMNLDLPHWQIMDHLYRWLDPFLVYLLTGWLFIFLLINRNFTLQFKAYILNFSYVALSTFFLLAMTGCLVLISDVVLKPGFGRARPRCRIEHSLASNALAGYNTNAELSLLSPESFQCPVAKIVFAHLHNNQFGQPPSTDVVLDLLLRNGMAPEQAKTHIETIIDGVGIGPYGESMQRNVTTFNKMAEWQQRGFQPFLTSWLFGEEERCEVTDSCPSGHVLRQGAVFFLSIIFVRWRWFKIRFFRSHPRNRWLLLSISTVALIWCMWSRLYGYRHTLSDEMLSIATLGGIAIVVGFGIAIDRVRATAIGQDSAVRVGLRELLYNAAVMVAYFDKYGKFQIWNHACEVATGYEALEIRTLDDYVKKLYPDAPLHAMKQKLMAAIVKGQVNRNVVTRIRTKTGQSKLILWNATPIYGNIISQAVGKLSIGVEISQLNSRLANLGFVGTTLLHDFMPYMEDIRYHAQQALRTYRDDLEAGKHCREIDAIAQRLRQDSIDFRNYVLGSAASGMYIDLPEIIESACRLIESRVKAKAETIEIRKDLTSEDIPPITGQAGALRHVILNLLRNAVVSIEKRQKMNRQCPAQVSVLLKKIVLDTAVFIDIEVIDTGIGMQPQMHRTLEKGFVFGISIDELGEIGLGLMEVLCVVWDHGGTLHCSDEPSGGTKVVIRLPC